MNQNPEQLFDTSHDPKLEHSMIHFLNSNMLDYRTLLFENLFPLVRASLANKDNILDLLNQSSKASFSITQNHLKMISNALPLCKRFVAQLNANNLLRQLFVKVVEELRANNTETANFFADKLVTLTDHAALAVYLLGEVLFRSGKFTKVNYLFHKNNLLFVDENFLDLTARSLLKLKKYDQCLKIVNNSPKISLYNPEGIF
jgi:predicted Zn-dependent protease